MGVYPVLTDYNPAFADFAADVEYRQRVVTTNHSTGVVTSTDTDVPIEAIVTDVEPRDAAGSGGRLQIGDVQFMVKSSELPYRPPLKTDRIIYDDVVYAIVAHDYGPKKYMTILYGRATREST